MSVAYRPTPPLRKVSSGETRVASIPSCSQKKITEAFGCPWVDLGEGSIRELYFATDDTGLSLLVWDTWMALLWFIEVHPLEITLAHVCKWCSQRLQPHRASITLWTRVRRQPASSVSVLTPLYGVESAHMIKHSNCVLTKVTAWKRVNFLLRGIKLLVQINIWRKEHRKERQRQIMAVSLGSEA